MGRAWVVNKGKGSRSLRRPLAVLGYPGRASFPGRERVIPVVPMNFILFISCFSAIWLVTVILLGRALKRSLAAAAPSR